MTITKGTHQYTDGSQVKYLVRFDSLSSQYHIEIEYLIGEEWHKEQESGDVVLHFSNKHEALQIVQYDTLMWMRDSFKHFNNK